MNGRRTFVAVWPPAAVVQMLAGLDRSPDPDLRWTSPEQWHVTLRFLGRVEDEQQDELHDAWEQIVLEPAQAVLGPATQRFGDRILHVPVAGLDRLAALVVGATEGVGEPPDEREFSGHLTLARAPRGSNSLRPLVGTPIEARWNVAEITLVVSHLRPSGAHYETVARRRLPCDTCPA
jgi:2'-5' RNA ligase